MFSIILVQTILVLQHEHLAHCNFVVAFDAIPEFAWSMAYDLRNTDASQTLHILPADLQISPTVPTKRIHDGEDLGFFLASKAYADIMTFVLQLNRSMIPEQDDGNNTRAWPLDDSKIALSDNVIRIASLIQSLKALMKRAPPETGPRRFGNVAFRTWFATVQSEALGLLKESLPEAVWAHAVGENERQTLEKEIESYLLGSFGSPERLDYGTGHELSFLAFLGCIWKLGGFARAAPGVEERAIVVGIIQPFVIPFGQYTTSSLGSDTNTDTWNWSGL